MSPLTITLVSPDTVFCNDRNAGEVGQLMP